MITVVKKGVDPDKKLWAATCYNCKSELTWLTKDAKRYNPGDQRNPDPFTQINCPVCGRTVTAY